MIIDVLCAVESLMNETSMINNRWMLKEITYREIIVFEMKFYFVSMKEFHDK